MPDENDLLKMRECSPLVHVKNVRAPVLMLIGGKDRRVPMSQGVSYYHNLKAKGEYGN
jgi:acylaminoacyl-peptidase